MQYTLRQVTVSHTSFDGSEIYQGLLLHNVTGEVICSFHEHPIEGGFFPSTYYQADPITEDITQFTTLISQLIRPYKDKHQFNCMQCTESSYQCMDCEYAINLTRPSSPFTPLNFPLSNIK